MRERPIHYAGALAWRDVRHTVHAVSAGYAACCSGERARAIRERGESTLAVQDVTCAKCLERIEKTRAFLAEGDDA